MSVRDQINSVLEKLRDASAGLFEINAAYQTAYEQGIYGCAIGKPSKRMKQILGVDREILIAVSTFTDQQQRTIKFVKEEIDKSSGRLESTLAIVLHNDAEGNSKLRNWGRDQGISILPIFGTSKLNSPDDLERTLCVELYSHDPFDVTGPVSDDSHFYGRREEALDLARKLQKGQIRSCLGIRKVGKTSIINRILREMRNHHDCICIMVDCSRDDVWELSAAQVLESLGHTIEQSLSKNERYASFDPVASAISMQGARDRLQAAILDCTQPLILVFDEIDYITPGSPTKPQWRTEFNTFWRNLRSIYQECDRRGHTLSILISGVSTYWFTVESIDGIENAALAFVPEEYLSPMPTGATVAMLRRLARVAGLQMDEAAAEAIAVATGNMPYWARKCCSYIHRNVPTPGRPIVLDAHRIGALVDAFVREEGAAISEVALRHLFRVHPDMREAAQKCNSGRAADVPESLRRALRRYGVLSIDDQIAGTMLSQAFDSLVSETQDVDHADHSRQASVPAFGLGEWAEELAVIGKRRNVLERKLRDFAVNFIRYDALTSGKQAEVKDRILSVVRESRRGEMRHLSAEEATARLMWPELVRLIHKEWRLFERLFGDRAAFMQACELINDRFDAHAKDADQADLALYRRALRQLEERIAKIQ